MMMMEVGRMWGGYMGRVGKTRFLFYMGRYGIETPMSSIP
jgi:hypothetical protein